MNTPFVHLHCHSHYSFLSGVPSVDDLLEETKRIGMSAVALTDTNGLYGAVPFYRRATSLGIRPILGVELDEPHGSERAVLIARNNTGFSELCRLVTMRHLDDGFRLEETLPDVGPDVLVITPSTGLLRMLAKSRPPRTTYAEICNMTDPADSGRIARLRALCAEAGIPAVATNDVHFLRPDDHGIHRILSAIREKITLTDLGEDGCVPREAWLKPPRDMKRLFREWPSAIGNTARIAETCRVELPLDTLKFPNFPLPPEETPSSFLWRRCFRGAVRRYRPPGREVIDRLRSELKVIDTLGFAPYFLVVWDIVRFARRHRIPMIGRGSAANSLVAYVLNITDIDPIRHDLFFERFLNPERGSPPDIDIDFCWKRRDRVLDYVYSTYGEDRVAMISTHVTMGARSAIREVGRAMGLPPSEISAFTSGVPHSRRIDKEWMRKNCPGFRALPLNREPYRTVLEVASRLTGRPRHISVHPGGIVISPIPLNDLVPLERARKGLVVTQYDMFAIEDLGLVKIDLLSQRSLSVLADTLEMVKRNGVPVPNLDDGEKVRGDPETRRLIREGRTMGCFYIESPAMRSLLKKLRVDDFEMLTAASSVIRPGVAKSGMMQQFIACHNGLREPTYLHPVMRDILGRTYGVMIYQEDVIKVAHRIAGMSLGEADLLRRAMSGKMRSHEAMKGLRDSFVAGAWRQGVARDMAEEIWRQIKSFAGYAFCKAHSASYALLSFKVAYLKAHHPAEFMAAVITNRGGFYHPTAYIEEARRMGIRILPPDVNLGETAFTGGGKEIRTGLMQVRKVTRRTLLAIEASRRKAGPFTSLRDFRDRTGAGIAEVEQLIRAGAFSSLGATRPELFWRLHLMKGSGYAAVPLFSAARLNGTAPPIPRPPDYPVERRLAMEVQTIGYNTTRHPLYPLRHLYSIMGLTEAGALHTKAGRRVRLLGWLIASKNIDTREGAFMAFLSLEDLSGTFEVVLFPAVYQRCGALLRDRGPYLVAGRVAEENGCHTVIAEWIRRIRAEESPPIAPLPCQ